MLKTLLLLSIPVIHAQPAFEAASIRPANPDARTSGIDILPGGRLNAVNVSLRALLKKAYRIRDFQIEQPPSWFDSARFDITATSNGATEKQVEAMLQSLLADRFQLKLRRESRESQVYILSSAKGGPKLTDAAPSDEPGSVRIRGFGKVAGLRGSMGQLAEALSDVRLNGNAILDRPVLDRTGLTGVYNFSLEWTPDLPPSDNPPPDRTGPSIFTAVQEQLGLKLEKQKAPVDMFIIDHVEKPSGN